MSLFQEREQRVEEIEIGPIYMRVGHACHYNNALDNERTSRASFRGRRYRWQATKADTWTEAISTTTCLNSQTKQERGAMNDIVDEKVTWIGVHVGTA